MELRKILFITLILLSLTLPSQAKIRRMYDKEKVEEKNDIIALNKLEALKTHLAPATVDNLNTIADWKSYMKKRNKLLKIMLKRYKKLTEG